MSSNQYFFILKFYVSTCGTSLHLAKPELNRRGGHFTGLLVINASLPNKKSRVQRVQRQNLNCIPDWKQKDMSNYTFKRMNYFLINLEMLEEALTCIVTTFFSNTRNISFHILGHLFSVLGFLESLYFPCDSCSSFLVFVSILVAGDS